jgi:hypothetical protein
MKLVTTTRCATVLRAAVRKNRFQERQLSALAVPAAQCP